MKTMILPLCAAALLAGCKSPYALEHDTLACDRMTDWSQRQACKEKVREAERDWQKEQKDREQKDRQQKAKQ